LGTVIGFTDTEEKTLRAIYEIITVQRDFGNRSDRKNARLKYTVDRMGVYAFKKEVEKRAGFEFATERPYRFTERTDYFGWHQNHEGKWYYTVFVENGRIADEKIALKTAFYEIALTGKAQFRFTANQKLILSDIESEDKATIEKILLQYGIIDHTEVASPMRRNSIACVAFNTCPLALAEAQRYLPSLISKIEPLLDKYGLREDPITIRMTGCPNGCGRPYTAEIGLIGTSYGKYNLHLGGDRLGLRLNTKQYDQVDEEQVLSILDSLFHRYSQRIDKSVAFGDYVYSHPSILKF
jgi:sulfite reductase (NADPH) hemoprotein beta-component